MKDAQFSFSMHHDLQIMTEALERYPDVTLIDNDLQLLQFWLKYQKEHEGL